MNPYKTYTKEEIEEFNKAFDKFCNNVVPVKTKSKGLLFIQTTNFIDYAATFARPVGNVIDEYFASHPNATLDNCMWYLDCCATEDANEAYRLGKEDERVALMNKITDKIYTKENILYIWKMRRTYPRSKYPDMYAPL